MAEQIDELECAKTAALITLAQRVSVLVGPEGKQGTPGKAGKDGKPGVRGPRGAAGADGKDGKDGIDGKPGEPGKDGPPGADGRDGLRGKRGEPGKPGPRGRDGAPGREGPRGPAGNDGRVVNDWAGQWQHGSYERGAIVRHKGSSWIAESGTSAEPGSGSGWAMFAARGRDGMMLSGPGGSSDGGGDVASVNGQTGVVVLDASDVGADAAGTAAALVADLAAVVNDHAARHQHGGDDEVATATPAANAIPKADSGGKLDAWVSNASTTVAGKVMLATDGETTAGEAVQASDTRLHARSHAMTGTSDHTAGNWRVFYSNGSGQIVELALGAAGTVLTSQGASAAPTFETSTNLNEIWVPASQWIPRVTNGCGVASRELSSVFNFDEATFVNGVLSYAQALVKLPNNWNRGTITARFCWTASSGSGTVTWGVQARALADDDALTSAFGTAQTVSDTLTAVDDMCITAATSAVTVGGSPSSSTPLLVQIYRDGTADSLGTSARLLGVVISFTSA